MKTNLTALLYRIATTSKILLGFICLILAFSLTGCGTTPPAALESYLFDTKTNFTPVVSVITNAAGIVSTETKLVPEVTQTPSVALKSWAGLASAVADTVSPGTGSLVGIGLLGGAGFFGLNRQRRLTAAVQRENDTQKDFWTAQTIAENFGQSIEVLREVVKTTPQGAMLDAKIVDMLHRNQSAVGIIREAATLVDNTVDNAAAKSTAQKILSLLPPQPITQS